MKALLFKKRDHILAKIPVLGNVTHMMIYMMMQRMINMMMHKMMLMMMHMMMQRMIHMMMMMIMMMMMMMMMMTNDSRQKHPESHTSERTFVPRTVIFFKNGDLTY